MMAGWQWRHPNESDFMADDGEVAFSLFYEWCNGFGLDPPPRRCPEVRLNDPDMDMVVLRCVSEQMFAMEER